jgi:transcription elongation factor Elf1
MGGQSITYICPRCNQELPTKSEYVTHLDAHRLGKVTAPSAEQLREKAALAQAAQPQVAQQTRPEPKPITLQYVYKGDCPKCVIAVETIEVDIANVHVAIAWCPRCKQQHEQREVHKL